VPEDRVPLFVRLPRDQAVALDRLADSTGRRKQHVVSELLADQLAVGHIELAEDARGEDVLTLDEAAALLRLPVEAIQARAAAGDLPGRAFGEEWRFSRPALLSWLAAGEGAQEQNDPGGRGQQRERGTRKQDR
jgi:excisionase family DNA binding protein